EERDGAPPRMKVAAVTYFEPWDWVIGAEMFEDDYFDARDTTAAILKRLLGRLAGGGALVMLLALGLAVVLGRRMARPILRLNALAGTLADGNIEQARLDLTGWGLSEGQAAVGDEIRQLAFSFRRMIEALGRLVGQVRQSGIQVTTSSTQIAASARQLEAAVTEQAAATSQVSATSREISATGRELAQTMDGVAIVAAETAARAGQSRTGLQVMETAMRQLVEATGSVTGRLSAISQQTTQIAGIVTTITKVADQTNLLSLNAAIEAEKAGEYGRGFAVVAGEVRRLADQTAVATLNIERMVKDMNSAVASGVMEMDRFVEQVRRGVEEVGRIGSELGGIIERVQELNPQFERVREGMQAQGAGAEQISAAMGQLTEASAQTRASLGEFNQATSQLTDAVQKLRREISSFRMEA
ncbi:MAG: methyl-accepting chemotaxis protein, partial [Verrucomicrobia bacterium]|nr:methyl-accepting chemotaxis protein [Verrucomicrobiota bacterium]